MAISHADKTIEHHIRPDGKGRVLEQVGSIVFTPTLFLGSSYQVVEYDSSTGQVIRRRTAQGYSNGR